MLTLNQRAEVYTRVDYFVAMGNEKLGTDLEGPHVRFDKRGTCGGTANYSKMELNFNAQLMLDNWDEYMNQIIPHEVAHLLKSHIYGRGKGLNAVHGFFWKSVMRALGVEPDRCHNMDISSVYRPAPKAKHIYVCRKCEKELVLSSVRHNRMVKGTRMYSHNCGGALVHKTALGTMTYREAFDHKMPAFIQAAACEAKKAPKKGTKISHAMVIYKAMTVEGVTSTRQDIIAAMSHSMQIKPHAAAGYYQNCKKRIG